MQLPFHLLVMQKHQQHETLSNVDCSGSSQTLFHPIRARSILKMQNSISKVYQFLWEGSRALVALRTKVGSFHRKNKQISINQVF